MAREEANREDLLHEATALIERIKLAPRNSQSDTSPESEEREHVVVGFRANGAFSVFFGDDPVYQFNAAGEWRRAFCDGLLLKASHGDIVSIRQVRTGNEVQLQSHALSKSEEAAFLRRMSQTLQEFAQWLDAGTFEIAGQVPQTADVLGRVREWLAASRTVKIAARPNA
jgi:hypothetical protein